MSTERPDPRDADGSAAEAAGEAFDTRLERWTETVLEGALEGRADLALLDAATELGASAGSVWRSSGTDGPPVLAQEPAGSWKPLRSRGPAEELPPETTLAAALAGQLDCSLPGQSTLHGGHDLPLGLVCVWPAATTSPQAIENQAERDGLLDALVILAATLVDLDDEGAGEGDAGSLLPQPGDDPDSGPRAA